MKKQYIRTSRKMNDHQNYITLPRGEFRVGDLVAISKVNLEDNSNITKMAVEKKQTTNLFIQDIKTDYRKGLRVEDPDEVIEIKQDMLRNRRIHIQNE